MFTAAVFTITNRKKQVKHPLIDKWISKVFSSHTMEYYLAIKRNRVLIHAVVQIIPENIMLSKKSLIQKATYYKFHCVKCTSRQTIENRIVIARIWEEEGVENDC